MTTYRYRQLLWFSVGLSLLNVALAFFPIFQTYSKALADAYANEPLAVWVSTWWGVFCILMPLGIAGLAGFIGLFFFKKWGRTLSLYTTIVMVLIQPFLGASLTSGIEDSVGDLLSMLWGAILIVSYCSPIRERFEQTITARP